MGAEISKANYEATVEPGDSVFLPRPGGFEGYFRDLGEPAGKLALPDYVPLLDLPAMPRAGARCGLTFLP